MRRRLGIGEVVLVATIVLAGGWLRAIHVATPSLWWDEFVQIRTADRTGFLDVWRAARDGVAPGTGNAGAAPLDYLALHAWYRVAPSATPATLELHHRLPALAYSIAALPLAWCLGRLAAGAVTGVALLSLLAVSPPAILYAAEARPYSLSIALVFANLVAFGVLLGASRRKSRRLAWAASCLALVLSSLYGIFPIALEAAALVSISIASREGRTTALEAVLVSILVVAACGAFLFAWLGPDVLGVSFRRLQVTGPTPWEAWVQSLAFFAGGNRLLLVLFAISPPLAVALAWRMGKTQRTLALVAGLAPSIVPLLVAIARWKQYYFHPRHALFLLPTTLLSASIVTAWLARRALSAAAVPRARRHAAAVAAVAIYVIATASTWVASYLVNPLPSFGATKTLRDFRGITRELSARVGSFEPGGRLLLVAERGRAGRLANPVLDFYLDASGLGSKVLLAGTASPQSTLDRLSRMCGAGCPTTFGPEVLTTLGADSPFEQSLAMSRFIRLSHSPWTWGTADASAVVTWTNGAAGRTRRGLVRKPFEGAVLDVTGTPRSSSVPASFPNLR